MKLATLTLSLATLLLASVAVAQEHAAEEAMPVEAAQAHEAVVPEEHVPSPTHETSEGVHVAPPGHAGDTNAHEHGEPTPVHGAPAHGGHAAAHAGPASCQEILSGHGGGHHLENPSVADVIFHHVTDAEELEFENPLPSETPSAAHVNFKKILCSATGWNGVVYQSGGFVFDLTPTKHTFWMWVASALLILTFVVGAPKKGQMVPTGLASLLEMLVLFVRDELAIKNIGPEGRRFTPYLCTCFFFILVMNLLGLVPLTGTPTGNVAVTLGLAVLTFLVTQGAAIRAAGLGGYLKHLTGGVHPALWPIMVPVEILGLFTKPFALTVRLFANMVAGHIVIYFLLGLIFIMKSIALAPVSLAFAVGIYMLELFVALVQAYVFTMLSSLFIGMGVAMGHHAHDDHAHDEHHGEGAHGAKPGDTAGHAAAH